jgi:hypothetical protein
MKLRGTAAPLACLIVLGASAAAQAQTLPSQPVVFGGGMLTLGGDVSATFGGSDPGFFNYTDYEHSALRMFRVDVTGSLKAGNHLSALGELRTENAGRPQAYALYLRIRPWTSRAFDIQVGRVPPTFGAFSRRPYAAGNPLIGYPLAYQYLTSLRSDAVPDNADELLGMRGRGWLSNFSIGNLSPEHGVPLANAFQWDTGVQIHAAGDLLDATASITTGTLSNPRVIDDNSGQQIAARVAFHPVVGLIIGASVSRGPFLANTAVRSAGAGSGSGFTQDAWGADAEYSRDYYLLRVETIVSRWTLPDVRTPFIGPIRASATSLEGRYKIFPGLYVAARVDHLGFSTIAGSAVSQTWDAPVTRLELGGGYSIQRNLLLKISGQFNRRDTARVPTSNVVATEIVFWL